MHQNSNLKEKITNILKTLFELTVENDTHITRWVEKTPDNILHINTLCRMFQNSKSIYIYRDPRDVFLSIKKKYSDKSIEEVCASYKYYYTLF